MIKAIQTKYKGYCFRSRLEARWAVYFDSLGIEWVYEPEGFELGDGVRYLPDFWIPSLDCFIEVKPGKTEAKVRKKVYLAGKMDNWRCKVLERYLCTNPYGVDKYSFHGVYNEMSGYDNYEGFGSAGTAIVRNSLDAVSNSDAVFAYISSLDCFGTIAEIGFARAKGKPIFTAMHISCIEYCNSGGHGIYKLDEDSGTIVGHAGHAHFVTDDSQDGARRTIEEKGMWGECWFPARMSNAVKVVHDLPEAESFFEDCLPPFELDQDEEKASLLSELSKKKVIVLRDVPESPCLATFFEDGKPDSFRLPGETKDFHAARSARFEHGENNG